MVGSQTSSFGWARKRLLERSEAVREDIRRELLKYDSERYSDLADQVADSGDKSVADLLVDIDLAEITRDVQEFRDIEAALLRIAHGTFGECIDCGGEIEPERLQALPSAAKCYRCQRVTENPERKELHRTI